MNIGKIKKKLKREVTAHPAKAVVLGVLCVVALWFWAPLVWGWAAPSQSTVVTVPQGGEPQLPGLAPPVAATTDAVTEPAQPAHSWQELVQWMENDPRTKPAWPASAARGPLTTLLGKWLPWSRLDAEERDPFSPPQMAGPLLAECQHGDSDPEPAPLSPPAISPRDAGAILTGVIASPSGGAAMINGRTYLEGSQVVFQKDGVSYAFELTEVRPGLVALMRDGRRYELRMPLPTDLSRSAAAVSAGTSAPDEKGDRHPK